MQENKHKEHFMKNYSNIIIGLFLIMLTFSLICLVKVSMNYKKLEERQQITQMLLDEVRDSIEAIPVTIEETNTLRIYYPKYSKIDLACEKMPSKNNDSIIMVCAAAYTNKRLDSFSHMNIVGNHVSKGTLYRGVGIKNAYSGAFAFYDDTPHFAYYDWIKEFREASSNGGCGFAQDMMIHNGERVHHWRDRNSSHEFRALCLLNGKIAIIDSKGIQKFGDFVDSLFKLGVQEALYLDMGDWKHSWYRNAHGQPIDIYSNPNKYATNWITFYK